MPNAVRTDLVSFTRPVKESSHECHDLILFVILSNNGRQSLELILLAQSGRPRYFSGREEIFIPMPFAQICAVFASILPTIRALFLLLTISPVNLEKSLMVSIIALTDFSLPLQKYKPFCNGGEGYRVS